MPGVTTNHDGNCTTFRIVGDLKGSSVLDLARLWREESQLSPKSMCIDLRSVREIDDPGKRLLGEMFGTGMEMIVRVKSGRRKHEHSNV